MTDFPALLAVGLVLATTGCSGAEQPAGLAFEVSGRLEDTRILEASGLARSQQPASDVLWIINDNGAKELVHAINPSGQRLGEFDLKKSKNRDWEDLASFSLDDKRWLMIADIGDNEARRDYRSLYFVEEPTVAKKAEAGVAWQVNYRYPDGPTDAEAAAVDTDNQRVLIVSKRTMPPRLYAVPLRPDDEKTVIAEALGPLTSLPKPTRQEVEFAPLKKDWYWQPVGMDISADNQAAVIITYRGLYYYQRQPGQDWYDAFNKRPLRVSLGNFRNAEAVAFGDNARTVYVTGESKHSAVLRIDLSGVAVQ